MKPTPPARSVKQSLLAAAVLVLAGIAGAPLHGLADTPNASPGSAPGGTSGASAAFTPEAPVTVSGKISSSLPFAKRLNLKPKDKKEFDEYKSYATVIAVKDGDSLVPLLQDVEKKAQAHQKARAPYRKAKGKETWDQKMTRMNADPAVVKTKKELEDAWTVFENAVKSNALPGAPVRSNEKGAFTITLPKNAYICCFWTGRIDLDNENGEYLNWASELCAGIEKPAKTLELRKASSLWGCSPPSF